MLEPLAYAPPASAPDERPSDRRWVAVLATLVAGAGAGHAALGRWRRAGLFAGTTVALVAAGVLATLHAHLIVGVVLVFAAAAMRFVAAVSAFRLARPPTDGQAATRWSYKALVPVWAALFLVVNVAPRFVRTHLVESFSIPAGSMMPTLLIGDLIFVDKRAWSPRQGDVVVFRHPLDPTVDYVKRVVALGGDTVEIRSGIVYVNGRQMPRTVVAAAPPSRFGPLSQESTGIHTHGTYGRFEGSDFGPVQVAARSAFMLGDNRDNSNDSRFWGVVPFDNVKGTVIGVWWSTARGEDGDGVRWDRIGLRLDDQ